MAATQRMATARTDARAIGIVRVDVVELRWRRGDRDKVWVAGPDCFKILQDLLYKSSISPTPGPRGDGGSAGQRHLLGRA